MVEDINDGSGVPGEMGVGLGGATLKGSGVDAAKVAVGLLVREEEGDGVVMGEEVVEVSEGSSGGSGSGWLFRPGGDVVGEGSSIRTRRLRKRLALKGTAEMPMRMPMWLGGVLSGSYG